MFCKCILYPLASDKTGNFYCCHARCSSGKIVQVHFLRRMTSFLSNHNRCFTLRGLLLQSSAGGISENETQKFDQAYVHKGKTKTMPLNCWGFLSGNTGRRYILGAFYRNTNSLVIYSQEALSIALCSFYLKLYV